MAYCGVIHFFLGNLDRQTDRLTGRAVTGWRVKLVVEGCCVRQCTWEEDNMKGAFPVGFIFFCSLLVYGKLITGQVLCLRSTNNFAQSDRWTVYVQIQLSPSDLLAHSKNLLMLNYLPGLLSVVESRKLMFSCRRLQLYTMCLHYRKPRHHHA